MERRCGMMAIKELMLANDLSLHLSFGLEDLNKFVIELSVILISVSCLCETVIHVKDNGCSIFMNNSFWKSQVSIISLLFLL